MLLQLNRQSVYRLSLPGAQPRKPVSGINQILLQLRSATGHDFSLYKKNAVGRRVSGAWRSTPSTIWRFIPVFSEKTPRNPGAVQGIADQRHQFLP